MDNKTYDTIMTDNALVDKWTKIGMLENGNKTLAIAFEIAAVYLVDLDDMNSPLNTLVFPAIHRIFRDRTGDFNFEELKFEVITVIHLLSEKLHLIDGLSCVNFIDCEAQFLAAFADKYKEQKEKQNDK